MISGVFFFNDTATTEIYTLSLHDALPILIPHKPSALCNPSQRAFHDPALWQRDEAFLIRQLAHDHQNDLIPGGDRKSTRLNSSHANISYAVFCLKKTTHTLFAFFLCSLLL